MAFTRPSCLSSSSGSVERTYQSSAPEGCTHQSSAPEGCTHQSSAPEGCTDQSSAPEGCTDQSSAPEGCTHQSSAPEGCTHQSSAPEGCTHQSSAPEGCTYPRGSRLETRLEVGGATQLGGRCGHEARLRHARLMRVAGAGAGSVHGEGGAAVQRTEGSATCDGPTDGYGYDGAKTDNGGGSWRTTRRTQVKLRGLDDACDGGDGRDRTEAAMQWTRATEVRGG
ncbi:NBS-LRR type resistance protein [Cucumis melo var. makuwa]|uniref:NBS-LRR type resistance protein n=1 Tax=Cucumis melo var. makuwa TaxID=1194695 RepID=A0A5A7T0S3_CUCMM|nr:NBS-LRR type resistance protein [Cucumis melo var. makuwa]